MLNKKQAVIGVIVTTLFGAVISYNSTYASNINTGINVNSVKVDVTSSGGSMNKSTNVNAKKIEGVEVKDSKNLSIKISGVESLSVTGSKVKILDSVNIDKNNIDKTDSKKIMLDLSKPLINGKTYSIISISDSLEMNIDFTFDETKKTIKNTLLEDKTTGIDFINVLSPTKIEINLNKEIKNTSLEFKILKEIQIDKMTFKDNVLNVSLIDEVGSMENYVMIFDLKDLNNKDIEIDDSLYDITTTTVKTSASLETDIIPTDGLDLNASDMKASTGEVLNENNENSKSTEDNNIEKVALEATQTPKTGLDSNIIIFITFILSIGLFLSRKNVLRENIKK